MFRQQDRHIAVPEEEHDTRSVGHAGIAAEPARTATTTPRSNSASRIEMRTSSSLGSVTSGDGSGHLVSSRRRRSTDGDSSTARRRRAAGPPTAGRVGRRMPPRPRRGSAPCWG